MEVGIIMVRLWLTRSLSRKESHRKAGRPDLWLFFLRSKPVGLRQSKHAYRRTRSASFATSRSSEGLWVYKSRLLVSLDWQHSDSFWQETTPKMDLLSPDIDLIHRKETVGGLRFDAGPWNRAILLEPHWVASRYWTSSSLNLPTVCWLIGRQYRLRWEDSPRSLERLLWPDR